MLLVAATSSTILSVAYIVLVSLYSYVVIVLIRFFVAGGLLYLRFYKGKDWTSTSGFKPWGGPTAAVIYFIVFGFLLVTIFIPPPPGSPFSSGEVNWYIVPTIGLGFLVLGYSYYLCLQYLIPRIRKEELQVERDPTIVKIQGEWVQACETVKADWVARSGSRESIEDGKAGGEKEEGWAKD